MSFWNTAVNFLTGKKNSEGKDVAFKDVLGEVNWDGVANVAGSYFLNRAFDSGGPDAGGGYQGDIPDYTAVRSRVANTYDPNRRPGSGGQRYFSDMQYVEPYAPTTPEIDQAVEDADDTTTDDTTPSTEGLAALDVVRQLTDKQAQFLEEQNVANPAYEAKPAALNINPTGATGIQALQAKNAATAGSGVNSLLPVPQYDDKGNVISMAKGGIARFAVGGRYLGGMTDGMADEVPASIDGKQPAALSDGEFVVPADVVSHLGNGNSNAGAKALHDMMANVRQDRTGNSEQGKEINATNYLPKVG
tara:strand:- start:186 stop:1097 length:912 start_codon:yes stop_codon:yes gene_type:complete